MFAGTYPSRLDDAHRVYEEIVASYPRNKSANYMLGVIDTEKAFRLVQRSGRYPRPLEDAQARAALAAKLSPLMADLYERLISCAPGNYQGDVVVLFIRTELPNVIHKRRE